MTNNNAPDRVLPPVVKWVNSRGYEQLTDDANFIHDIKFTDQYGAKIVEEYTPAAAHDALATKLAQVEAERDAFKDAIERSKAEAGRNNYVALAMQLHRTQAERDAARAELETLRNSHAHLFHEYHDLLRRVRLPDAQPKDNADE